MQPSGDREAAERGVREPAPPDSPRDLLRPHRRPRLERCTTAGPFRDVLVCLDGSVAGEAALPLALGIARSCGARLHLLRVLEADSPSLLGSPTDALDWEMARVEARDYLRRLEERFDGQHVAVVTALTQGRAAEQILRYAHERSVDLIAIGSHGEKGITEWNLAGTAEKVVSRPGTSLLLVPTTGSPPSSHGEIRLRRILVPLDASQVAECVLPALIPLARRNDACLILTHVVPTPPLLFATAPSPDDLALVLRLTERNTRVARDYLRRLEHRFREERIECKLVVEAGSDVHQTLSDVGEREHADLVVLSSHGSTANQRQGYGSVAWHMVSGAKRPLLVVRGMRAPVDDPSPNWERTAEPLRGLFADDRR